MRFKSALVAGAVVLASAGPLATPASAAQEVLYEHGALGSQGMASDRVLSNAVYNAEGADDFTVPAGETWSIGTVEVVGVDYLAGGHSWFEVSVYEDDGGVPGTLLTTRTAYSTILGEAAGGCCPGSTFEQSLALNSSFHVGAGTYWLGLEALGSPDTTQQWFWHHAAVTGAEAHWRNPADGYGTGCTEFAPAATCSAPPSTDFAFKLVGDVAGVVQFAAASFDVDERYAPNGRATITVTRTGDLSEPSSVSYATSNGSAQAAQDYVATWGTLTFAPGESEKTFQVRILRDTSTEGTETVVLTLGNPSSGTVVGAPNPATLNINDDI